MTRYGALAGAADLSTSADASSPRRRLAYDGATHPVARTAAKRRSIDRAGRASVRRTRYTDEWRPPRTHFLNVRRAIARPSRFTVVASPRTGRAAVPVAGSTMCVSDGHDNTPIGFDTVNDPVRESAGAGNAECRNHTPATNTASGRFACAAASNSEARTVAAIGLRAAYQRSSFVSFDQGVAEKLKLAGHGQLPRGYGDAPPPTGSSWPTPHLTAGAAVQPRSTTLLLHRRRSRGQDSRSDVRRALHAPPPGVKAPRPAVAWHS